MKKITLTKTNDKYILEDENNSKFEIKFSDLRFDGKLFYECFYQSSKYNGESQFSNSIQYPNADDNVMFNWIKQLIETIDTKYKELMEIDIS